jgi:hypothetical protein
MHGRSLATIVLLAAFAPPGAAIAQDSAAVGPFSLGTAIGEAILILLAVLAGLSVVAKLSIIFGVVPREPQNRFQALVHGAANFVGRLRPARSIRDQRRDSRITDDRRRF